MVTWARAVADGVEEEELRRRKRMMVPDGGRVSVPLFLTDSAPYRRPVFDGALHRPGPVIDALQGRARVTDAAAGRRARCDDEYERRSNLMADAWTWNKLGVLAPVAVGDAPRDAWIRRISTDYQRGAPRYDLDPTRSANNTTPLPNDDDDDDDGDGDSYATDPYARSVWSAQTAIRSGSPDNADRVEAMQRRMSMSQLNATAESVAGERRRYRPRDAAAIADKETAYAEYCRRIENDWQR
jgi:hypothetical protein